MRPVANVNVTYDAKALTHICGTNPLPGMYEQVNGTRRQSAIRNSTSSQPIAASTSSTARQSSPITHHCSGAISAIGSATANASTVRTLASATSARPSTSSVILKIQLARRSIGTDRASRIAGIERNTIVIGAQSRVQTSALAAGPSTRQFALSRLLSTRPPAPASRPTTRP